LLFAVAVRNWWLRLGDNSGTGRKLVEAISRKLVKARQAEKTCVLW
jgi:hypothetical protein